MKPELHAEHKRTVCTKTCPVCIFLCLSNSHPLSFHFSVREGCDRERERDAHPVGVSVMNKEDPSCINHTV